ncbi:DMT family transporter [uncultured Ferrimonas sp.]|uniref:DMT family transporter n=1 Tax=uncultured Ferrimonas sp. TaxID=432640 RepID=UPI0026313624|nr:DMT family transporter [uncultured Ferrimonas sp.]
MMPLAANGRGALFALVSTGLYVAVGIIVRLLSGQIDLFEILLFRQSVLLLVLLPALWLGGHTLFQPKRIDLHALRVLGAFAALSLSYLTVSNLPLADATALGFTQVLFVALISRITLKEPVTRQRWLVIAVGFIGVALIVQPQFDHGANLYLATGLIAALCTAVAVLCVKRLTLEAESGTNILAYQAIFVAVLAAPLALLNWQWPTNQQLPLLLAVGGLSAIAQWFALQAYKRGEANVVANVEYARILYAIGFGYLLFAEVPNLLAQVGVAILIGSALLPWWWQRQ